jgi:hypothetical protein
MGKVAGPTGLVTIRALLHLAPGFLANRPVILVTNPNRYEIADVLIDSAAHFPKVNFPKTGIGPGPVPSIIERRRWPIGRFPHPT